MEVMFAIAVLGAVLGSAYVIVNRNININQASQERQAAIKIAESQLERLKVRTAVDEAIPPQNNFCLSSANTVRLNPHAACRMNSASMPSSQEPVYSVSITKVADISVNGDPQGGVRFKISIRWASLINQAPDNLDYFYEVYK